MYETPGRHNRTSSSVPPSSVASALQNSHRIVPGGSICAVMTWVISSPPWCTCTGGRTATSTDHRTRRAPCRNVGTAGTAATRANGPACGILNSASCTTFSFGGPLGVAAGGSHFLCRPFLRWWWDGVGGQGFSSDYPSENLNGAHRHVDDGCGPPLAGGGDHAAAFADVTGLSSRRSRSSWAGVSGGA